MSVKRNWLLGLMTIDHLKLFWNNCNTHIQKEMLKSVVASSLTLTSYFVTNDKLYRLSHVWTKMHWLVCSQLSTCKQCSNNFNSKIKRTLKYIKTWLTFTGVFINSLSFKYISFYNFKYVFVTSGGIFLLFSLKLVS